MKDLRLGATASLVLLFAINLANYVDRYLVIALGKPIKTEFGLTDAEVGALTTSFVVVYMLASPLAGWIADRLARRWVIASAVGLWSAATALASRAWAYPVLLGTRAAVGIGEAGYNASGQALLSDLFPPEKRSRALAIFSLAFPVGAAGGYGLAGMLEHSHLFGLIDHPLGWRGACLAVGLPGILLAALATLLPNPVPQSDEPRDAAKPAGGTLEAYLGFLKDPVYVTNTAGFAMQSFALGGLAQWAPMFFDRVHKMDNDVAVTWIGGIVAGAGFVGTLLGAFLGDLVAKRGSLLSAYGWVTAAGYFLAVPFVILGLTLPKYPALACMFVSMVGAFLGTGPQNAIISARAPVAHRASAFAFVVVLLHVFGDAPSPYLMGKVSDAFQARAVEPGPALQYALFLAPLALVLAGVAMSACALFARRAHAVRAEDAR